MKPKWVKIGYGLIVLWMIWPLLPAFLAVLIAWCCGCQLDESKVHPCIVCGHDIGEGLYTMFCMAFVAMGTCTSSNLLLAAFSLFVWWRKRAEGWDQDSEPDRTETIRAKQNWVLGLGLASVLFSFLTAIPALIVAVRVRPLITRAKVGMIVAILVMVVYVVVPVARSLRPKHRDPQIRSEMLEGIRRSGLWTEQTTNQAPEDTARKLADPQR